ncbi:GIY-YIG nuclease family protein [Saccharicrinis fermentans]|uniref:GIY-YIG domain-containing protein n=1 Tax=Saccharicrinis fermentans DSM 9555 = JCM 21142 TaxID=869213 RepID=W7YE35_9BACT|nr:GIY-YIG nuclease family protein [Saccharicrinis fermentans]GAF05728.1 hypothetical protein JCM21142_104478 [Saccharicrinis fermentans DSM 9555 = JCM 21142]
MTKGYTYILECSDGSYYTGSTKDLELRLQQHQNGEGANHTRKHLPVKLVYFEEFDRIDDAFYREKQIQGWSRKKKEALINGDFDKLSHLSRNYTEYRKAASTSSASASATRSYNTTRPLSQEERSLSLSKGETKQRAELAEGKEGYKKTKIGWIPEEWELVKLGEKFEFKNGINADKSAYGTGVRFVNVMEVVNNNYITHNDIPGSLVVTKSQLMTYKVSRGDVLFNRTSEIPEEIGLTAVYLDDANPVFGGFVIRGTSKDNSLYELFKKDCFNSSILRKQIIVRGQGAVRANIGQKDLQSVLLPLPPLPEQQKIAQILSTWDKGIMSCELLISLGKKTHVFKNRRVEYR